MSNLDEQERESLEAAFADYNPLTASEPVAEKAFKAGRAYRPYPRNPNADLIRQQEERHKAEVAQLRERIEGLGAANQHGREDAGSLDVQVDELTREAKKLREALSDREATMRIWSAALHTSGEGTLECKTISDSEKFVAEFMILAANALDDALAVSPSTGRSEVPASVSEGKSLGESIREASAEVDSWPPPFGLYEPEGSLEREEEMGEGVNDLY